MSFGSRSRRRRSQSAAPPVNPHPITVRQAPPASATVRPFRRSTTILGLRLSSSFIPPDHSAPHDAAERWRASWAPMAGCASAILAACARPILTRPGTASRSGCGRWRGLPCPAPGCPPAGAGALPRFGAVWAGRRAPQAPLRQARSASGSDATGSLRSRTTAVLRACRARLARPRATAPEARRRHRAGEHLGQQEPGPCPTRRSRPPTASAAR